jgi:ABC-2 type transport system ATP-binding protein
MNDADSTRPCPAVIVRGVTHRYGDRVALDDFSLSIDAGEVFALLGPNGSGKTTLFRILSTLIPPQTGQLSLLGADIRTQTALVRHQIGVVFQSPSVDGKLTVRENLVHQAALYGLSPKSASLRIDSLLDDFGLAERAGDLLETLSGGLRRQVELAKALLHEPRLLLLDEPSTGLDPGARIDLWRRLLQLRDAMGVTIALTTHLLEEAEKADRIAILNEGRLVAMGSPDTLRRGVGGDSIMIETQDAEELCGRIQAELDVSASVIGDRVRLETRDGQRWVSDLLRAFPDEITAIKLGKPTLEDVFISKTGRTFSSGPSDGELT